MVYRIIYKRKRYILAIIILGLFILTYRYLKPKHSKEYYEEKCKLNLSYVVVHIDLKRTPVKLEYLTSLLPTLKDLGANGLLMEYEDMFPYTEDLANLTAKSGYRRNKLKTFLKTCNHIGVEVIPLIQTFGHMENALKLEEFHHLREHSKFADSICPSKLESRMLIRNMLSQVIEFHNSVVPLKHFHIGCDEVYRLNLCKECKRRGQHNSNILLEHLQEVSMMVKSLSKDTNVLFWDDMLRNNNLTLDVLNVPLEPVVWRYRNHIRMSDVNMWKYHKKFQNIWIASAFKGADGPRNIIPNMKKRFHNHYSWFTEIRNYKFGGETEVFNFKGIILTGWSRYNYFEGPVDILPVAIPSLLLNLLLFAQVRNGIDCNFFEGPSEFYTAYLQIKFKKLLNCDQLTIHLYYTVLDELLILLFRMFKLPTLVSDFLGRLNRDELFHYDNMYLDRCNFTEWNIYKGIEVYIQLTKDFFQAQYAMESRKKADRKAWCRSSNDIMYGSRYKLLRDLAPYYEPDFVIGYVKNVTEKLRKYWRSTCKI